VFENRVLKRIFGPKREEGPKQWKKDMRCGLLGVSAG